MDLALGVFMEFVAPDYPEEGVKAFRGVVGNPDAVRLLEVYGAFDGDRLTGVLATRNEGAHISPLLCGQGLPPARDWARSV